jgi:hypothetical protein
MTSEKIVVLNREGLHVARKFCVVGTMAATAFLWVGTATAIPTEEASLNACQNAVKTAAARYVSGKVGAVAWCLQAISTHLIKYNAADASKAANLCPAVSAAE